MQKKKLKPKQDQKEAAKKAEEEKKAAEEADEEKKATEEAEEEKKAAKNAEVEKKDIAKNPQMDEITKKDQKDQKLGEFSATVAKATAKVENGRSSLAKGAITLAKDNNKLLKLSEIVKFFRTAFVKALFWGFFRT